MRPKLVHVTTVDLSLALLLRAQLERFAEEGFDVLGVSSPGDFGHALARTGLRHVSIRSLGPGRRPEDDLRATGELVRLFRRERPALVHAHDRGSSAIVRLAARLGRVPAIVETVHGPSEEAALEPSRRSVRSERAAMRLSHHVLFQSESDQRWALRNRTALPARSSWLGSGVDVRRFDPAKVDPAAVARMRQRWRLGEDERVVGTLMLRGRPAGAREFERAIRHVSSHPTPVVVSVGARRSSEPSRIGEIVHAQALAEELPIVLSAFDVLVLPTARACVPRWVLEASAMQRPVVVGADVAAEVVENGVTGWVGTGGAAGSLGGAVDDLVRDPGLAEAMGKSGRARVLERFDEEAVAERSLQVYRRLLSRHGIRWDGEKAEV